MLEWKWRVQTNTAPTLAASTPPEHVQRLDSSLKAFDLLRKSEFLLASHSNSSYPQSG
jgi:hypothetical protein